MGFFKSSSKNWGDSISEVSRPIWHPEKMFWALQRPKPRFWSVYFAYQASWPVVEGLQRENFRVQRPDFRVQRSAESLQSSAESLQSSAESLRREDFRVQRPTLKTIPSKKIIFLAEKSFLKKMKNHIFFWDLGKIEKINFRWIFFGRKKIWDFFRQEKIFIFDGIFFKFI